MQEMRDSEGGSHAEGEGRKGPPEGSQCELCGRVGPKDSMGFLSREFDAQNPEFLHMTRNLPARHRPIAGRVKLCVWAHKEDC